jgi:hypothetical protein
MVSIFNYKYKLNIYEIIAVPRYNNMLHFGSQVYAYPKVLQINSLSRNLTKKYKFLTNAMFGILNSVFEICKN